MITPASELRDAAARLRETYAEFINHKDVRGDIDLAEWSEWFGPDAGINLDEINAWIALMSPALAEPLAAWLEAVADKETALRGPWNTDVAALDLHPFGFQNALTIARLITGGEPS